MSRRQPRRRTYRRPRHILARTLAPVLAYALYIVAGSGIFAAFYALGTAARWALLPP